MRWTTTARVDKNVGMSEISNTKNRGNVRMWMSVNSFKHIHVSV